MSIHIIAYLIYLLSLVAVAMAFIDEATHSDYVTLGKFLLALFFVLTPVVNTVMVFILVGPDILEFAFSRGFWDKVVWRRRR